MGRTFLIVVTVLAAIALFLINRPVVAMSDDDNLQLKELWKEYAAVERKDLPQKQLAVLEKIITEAKSRHVPYDYYVACASKAQVRRRINWKDYDDAMAEFRRSVEDYGLPVMQFWYNLDRLSASSAYDYAKSHSAELRASNVPGFSKTWFSRRGVLDAFVGSLIRNDLEFALWACRQSGVKCSADLKEVIGDRYPDLAILEYLDAYDGRNDGRRKELEAHAGRYEGKAASMLSRAALLLDRMSELGRNDASTSEQYKKLYDDCRAFERQRKSFGGAEAKLADCETRIEALVSTLESRSVNIRVKDDSLSLSLRNLDRADVEFVSRKDGKSVWKTSLENKAGSFYVYDEVSVLIPGLDDGSYDIRVKGKDVDVKSRYNRNTISVAVRQDSRGHAIYVADYKTGEPLNSVDVVLMANDKEVAAAKGVALNGFTLLPDNLESALRKDGGLVRPRQRNLVCSYVDEDGRYHSSSNVWFYDYYDDVEESMVESVMANVMLDRGAFKPGETVQYKAVVYDQKGMEYSAAAGRKVTVLMYDAEGNEAGKAKLTTNEFGSVAGSFDIPVGLRNGYFRVSVMDGDSVIGDAGFSVDEFVLPTFDVRFETIDRFFLEGDAVRIKAWANSYSGHSLSSAKVYARISQSHVMSDDELEVVTVADDGSFEIVAKDVRSGYHSVIVKVVDGTGETLEFSTSFNVLLRPSVNLELLNTVEASRQNVVVGDVLKLIANVGYENAVKTGNNADAEIIYRIVDERKNVVGLGSLNLSEQAEIDMKPLSSGLYSIEVEVVAKKADGSVVSAKTDTKFVKISDDDTSFDADVDGLFRLIASDQSLQMASGRSPMWACVEVFGPGRKLLRSEVVKIDAREVVRLGISHPKSWPDVVSVNVFFFRNGRDGRYGCEIRRDSSDEKLPLAISRFSDVTAPSTKYGVSLKTNASVEAVASIFDKATMVIHPNFWYEIYRMRQGAPYIAYQSHCGSSELSYYGEVMFYGEEAMTMGAVAGKAVNDAMVTRTALRAKSRVQSLVVEEEEVEYESMSLDYDGNNEPETVGTLREEFANTVAFEPFLRSDRNGEINFEFTTSDKLSTYIISVFAHDKSMNSAVVRDEFKVTIPVKLSVMEPQLLYVGDKYVLKANLSNSSESSVGGKVSAYVYTTARHETASPVSSQSRTVEVAAGGAAGVEFEIDVPKTDVLGLKIVFSGKDGQKSVSDGVFVTVPVRPASQTIREAHSSIMLAGQDKDAIVAQLRSMFVNVPSDSAVLSEKTIMDMVREAIPDKISTDAKDVISLVEALYASVIAKTLGMAGTDAKLLDRILACRNGDGGFGWFEGMSSSPMVTATVLRRAASLQDRGLELGLGEDVIENAVKYMDSQMFKDKKRPSWCGGVSMEQYLLIRAHYAAIDLSASPDPDFRKAAKQYLVPKKDRGAAGALLMKARRIRTLSLLAGSEDGLKLARAFGIRISAGKKMQSSLEADVASLVEYAVGHRSGGKYFPNAVMPYRGLMESELHAHALLCDIFRDFGYDDLADAIRIWIMVQKETQQWDDDPAFMEAISSVMDGSDAVKDTRVLILSGEKELPFQQIKSAGNGFKVEVLYKREDGTVLKSGDVLSVGDKIVSEVKIWNEENRSFVHLSVPRPVSLRPERQLSGMMGWWLRPLFVDGWYSFTPQGYRNVKAGMTEYFFDSYPEENTVVSETFFVTQAGVFSAPVASIECLYAPHYVANSDYTGALESR